MTDCIFCYKYLSNVCWSGNCLPHSIFSICYWVMSQLYGAHFKLFPQYFCRALLYMSTGDNKQTLNDMLHC
uniref:Uncharacterized protein n=1 Tax=Arundo donax TaxID=35708 RepID=A0A0A8ZNK4_ARUDO